LLLTHWLLVTLPLFVQLLQSVVPPQPLLRVPQSEPMAPVLPLQVVEGVQHDPL
jgi:hypothetical protein